MFFLVKNKEIKLDVIISCRFLSFENVSNYCNNTFFYPPICENIYNWPSFQLAKLRKWPTFRLAYADIFIIIHASQYFKKSSIEKSKLSIPQFLK